ncbi:type I-F CRISPR-associated protein Csy2 [Ketobacter sp. MCCC 1A13808]|nr:type I-F CRISPR-associated protein Csy2 [Ketobacter sp. MCCC 1A13808]
MMDAMIVIRNIQVSAANAIAGFTWGFPAISNFLGYVHALQRKLPDHLDIEFSGCAVICHNHKTQAYQPKGFADYSFALTRNPLTKTGASASFVEEGRMNMEVTLLISVVDNMFLETKHVNELVDSLGKNVQMQHLAGGLIGNQPKISFLSYQKLQENHRALMFSLLPGFALVSRHDLLLQQQRNFIEQDIENPELQAWLSFSSLTYRPVSGARPESPEKVEWERVSPFRGWLKPISIGYRPISEVYEAGVVAKVRDANTPAGFVENLYSIGEWLSPHRIKNIEQLIWQNSVSESGDYICINHYQSA